MRVLRFLVVTALLGSAAACASTRTPTDGITRLERQRAANPRSADVHRALGIAYFKAGRHKDARTALEEAHRFARQDGVVLLYLGMSAEELGDLPAAKRYYSSYLTFGRTRRVRSQLEARLAALTRKELELVAKQALASESTIAQQPGSPRTIAVLPMRFVGQDSSLRPLERGLAELLITDLSRSKALTVVERGQLQALLNEMSLQETARIDATSAVRTGRLLRAGRIVQGSIAQLQDNQLRVDAAVVDVPTTQAIGAAQGSDGIEQLFALEKRLAFDLFEELGVTLTPEERALVEQRPTRSLAAFLAYSAGLLAEDEGRFDEASRNYQQAHQLDPSFNMARQRGEQAQAVQAAASVSTTTIEQSLAGTSEGQTADAAARGQTTSSSSGELAKQTADNVNSSQNADAAGSSGGSTTTNTPSNDPAGNVTNTNDPVTAPAKVVIVIKQP